MAGLRKKEQWLDHGQALEATSVAKAAERCHVHPTTAFRRRHRFLGSPVLNKPRTVRGIVEADETFILESFKGRRSDLPRPPRKRGGKAKHPGLFFGNIPILVAPDPRGRNHRRGVAQCRPRLGRGGAGRRGHARQSVRLRRRIGDHGLRPQSEHAGPCRSRAGQAQTRGARPPYQQRQRLSRPAQWMRRFHGVAAKNLPNYFGWRR
jgi:hypothetical protein